MNIQDQGSASQGEGQTANESQEQTLTELASLEKFKFDGRELTPDQLRKERMLNSDYTKKTQEIGKEREFYAALPADLKAIRANPKLASQFRQIYPANFHHYLDLIDSGAAAKRSTDKGDSEETPNELMERLERAEKYIQDQETAKNEAVIDRVCAKFAAKYPEADEDLVLSRAQTLADQDVTLTDAHWDKLWKGSHDRNLERITRHNKDRFNKQKAANGNALESSRGGGTPGTAPRKLTMKEATEQAIKDFTPRR